MQYVVSASHAVSAIPPATITLAVTFLSIFFGSLAAGLAGFAFSAIAGAMLFHRLEPIEAVPLLLACSITPQLLSITRLWGTMQWRLCIPYLIGGIAGIPVGASLLEGFSPHTFAVGFGIFSAPTCFCGRLSHLTAAGEWRRLPLALPEALPVAQRPCPVQSRPFGAI
jgi:uncharacterized membrane protein YfcA